ncbi:MAG: 2,3-bisphosphoglycerate-independent phosphoglycerate mutase, partial [Clostridia bacterium]|nr:2,3-bisphosphoglycerate-independent phosphoglycerate mutase [Clostridia bacterium]
PSDKVSFDERPWMKCAEVTDAVLVAMESGKYGFIRCNYPNGDMVGHTGSLEATIIGVASVDLCLARIMPVAEKLGYTVLITADHGNADEMLEKNKKGKIAARTAHSLNPVPFIMYGTDRELKEGNFGLANIAPTVVELMGIEAPASWMESMLK